MGLGRVSRRRSQVVVESRSEALAQRQLRMAGAYAVVHILSILGVFLNPSM
jgi:uncharacterized membrane protein